MAYSSSYPPRSIYGGTDGHQHSVNQLLNRRYVRDVARRMVPGWSLYSPQPSPPQPSPPYSSVPDYVAQTAGYNPYYPYSSPHQRVYPYPTVPVLPPGVFQPPSKVTPVYQSLDGNKKPLYLDPGDVWVLPSPDTVPYPVPQPPGTIPYYGSNYYSNLDIQPYGQERGFREIGRATSVNTIGTTGDKRSFSVYRRTVPVLGPNPYEHMITTTQGVPIRFTVEGSGQGYELRDGDRFTIPTLEGDGEYTFTSYDNYQYYVSR